MLVPQPFRPCQGDILQGKVVCLQNDRVGDLVILV